VHGAANAFSTPAVHWIRFIYLSVIVGTIGLMAAHNLLDFGKKLRHPAPAPPALRAVQPERMTRPLRWQHGLVIVSFVVLVYSGFALNYPESWWAAPLLLWETHLPLRGVLHRIAAVVMMAALLWHLGHLAGSRRMRACMRGIWPALKDLKDAGAMLAYYVGRRPARPHMGEFNYIEKAEYWAFMWGTSVVTVSGLLLWCVDTTLRYLPGWVPDVASAIHFYEAILATLSLLVWHFYWVIFDPDVYPVDWTFWTGHSPASRVLERVEPLVMPEPTQPSACAPPTRAI
jgi:cytochrome b subunit of formate dehydrogenase